MIKFLLKQDGLSLIEALVALMLLTISILSVMTMITAFPRSTTDDLVLTCLLQAASSGIEAKRANHSLGSLNVPCGGRNVSVSISGTPPSTAPQPGSGNTACATVTATATYGSKTMTLRDLVCNFPD